VRTSFLCSPNGKNPPGCDTKEKKKDYMWNLVSSGRNSKEVNRRFIIFQFDTRAKAREKKREEEILYEQQIDIHQVIQGDEIIIIVKKKKYATQKTIIPHCLVLLSSILKETRKKKKGILTS